jgi:hypothetical protein
MMCGRQEPIRDRNPHAMRDDLSPLEVIATQRVYAAGLRPGASRASFQAAGLVP